MNRQITSSEIETLMKEKEKSQQTSSEPDCFTGELKKKKTFKEELTHTFLNYSKKLKRKECF